MTAAAQQSPDPNKEPNDDSNRRSSPRFIRKNRRFLAALLSIVLVLLTLGTSGFWYLTGVRPMSATEGYAQPIAAATAFVPASSPFALSLLTRPDRLIARRQVFAEGGSSVNNTQAAKTAQIDQTPLNAISKVTGVDYEQDIQPWLGNEATFALTDIDIDRTQENGQQPGYLWALEIAPTQIQKAHDFLQLFWQRQSPMGQTPSSERISGVRLLYRDAQVGSPAGNRSQDSLTASALVGDRFILLSNDVRVLRRSVQSRQTATNLAQNKAYRRTVERLPESRVALAYVDTSYIKADEAISPAPSAFAAVSLALNQAGVLANIQKATTATQLSPVFLEVTTGSGVNERSIAAPQPAAALSFLPASSSFVVAGQHFSQLKQASGDFEIPVAMLPNFLQIVQVADDSTDNNIDDAERPPWKLWDWADSDYALGQVNVGKDDWILATKRSERGVLQLDEAAKAKGYSIVPVMIGEEQAIAWTRFKARQSGRSQPRTADRLETEILGLHLQQGEYEVFAGTYPALEQALVGTQASLIESPKFAEAIADINPRDNSYLHADWKTLDPFLTSSVPVIKRVKAAVRPWLSSVETVSATRDAETARVFIQLAPQTTGD